MVRFKTQINEIVGKPPVMDHISYISCFSPMLIFAWLKREFLMEILEKTIHYLSGFRENKFLQIVKSRFLMETLTG